jgi:UDP-N-acetylmuramyl pentapeptide phosphotransferase/UDP-N-acetylglucosamine-1-phosphate transferase
LEGASLPHTVSLLWPALATFACSLLIVLTRHWHGRFSMDGLLGVQKLHTQPTPRVGGVAVALGLGVAWLLAGQGVRGILGPMLVAGIPAFAFGLAEDLTKRVGVKPRLLATMCSGYLAWYLTGVAMQETGFAPLDWALRFLPAAVVFTAFAVGGVANAVNIIDGFNGLAAGTVAIMLGAMGLIALQVGDTAVARVCFGVVAVSLGFAAVNWPLGKLFLGDGGAYLLGFVVAWVAVLLPMRHESLNAWATLLVCAYPVLEVGFSVRRRQRREGHHPGHPDRAHLHHFIHRRIVRKILPHVSPALQNGITSPLCWLFAALPALWAVAYSQHTAMLALGFLITAFLYSFFYARLTQFHWCFSARTIRQKHALRA